MNAVSDTLSLDDIRREIDGIDGQILALLARRLAASGKVRQVKSRGPARSSPIRPAREAMILRRLMDAKPEDMDGELLVRLWRVILTSSTLAQAPVSVHLTGDAASAPELRVLVADHFCAMPVINHQSMDQLLDHLANDPAGIGAVVPQADWSRAAGQGLQVMGRLPCLTREVMPRLLVIGHCDPQPTGDDETVLFGDALPDDLRKDILWHCASGGQMVHGVQGFLGEVLAPGLTIAGRYPRPIEADS